MIFFAYAFSFLIGYLLILRLLKKTTVIPQSLHCAFALGLGLGASGLLTFYGILFYGRFEPWFIMVSHILLLAGLIVTNYSTRRLDFLRNIRLPPAISFWGITALLTWIVLSIVIYYFAQKHPYGEWDAWSLWNMKLKFLVYGQDSWKNIFKLHWHTQPDYPLLLPLINAWVFAFSKSSLTAIPLTTAVSLTLLCAILLWQGLKIFIPERIALLASVLLLSHPYYILMATSQYADILFAIYLLASFISLKLAIVTQERGLALLTGLFWGLLTFTKNEGIALAILLAALFIGNYLLPRRNGKKELTLIVPLLLSLTAVASATLIFKFLLAPPNRDILNFSLAGRFDYFNWDGLKIILIFISWETLHERWHFLWIVIGLMGVLKLPNYFLKENKIFTLFFIVYSSILIYIYLTTTHFDLIWRLTRTLQRIYCYLLPSVLFLCFYIHWQKKET